MSEKEDEKGKEAERDDASDEEGPSGAAGSDGEGDPAASEEEAERAQRVAAALGVADEDEAAAEGEAAAEDAKPEGEEAAAAPNRAQRRREEALERRRKRKGLAAKKEGEEALPKDKNKRAKELLARRRESASSEQKPAQLEAGEMVDDALARGWAGTTKWARKNLGLIQAVAAVGLIGAAGFIGYTYFTQKTMGESSALLASGVMAEAGDIMPEEKEDRRSEDDKEYDPRVFFKSPEERADKALEGYRKTQAEHPGTGVAFLAKLGEAGVLLEKREWDQAIAAYDAVLQTSLAGADADVKGRAIEGLGFAKEGKGDLDGALAEFRRLETIDAKWFKELSQYHQARVLLAKNTDDDRAKAKDLLKAAYDKLKEPALEKKPMPYLEEAVQAELRSIDPSLVPDRETMGGVRGGQMSQEELQKQLRKIQEQLGKQQDGDPH